MKPNSFRSSPHIAVLLWAAVFVLAYVSARAPDRLADLANELPFVGEESAPVAIVGSSLSSPVPTETSAATSSADAATQQNSLANPAASSSASYPSSVTPLLPSTTAPASLFPSQLSALPPQSIKFTVGDRILVSVRVKVRSSPAIQNNRLGAQSVGASGTVVSGPVQADDYIWWNINYDSGTDGWSAGNFLKKSIGVTPPLGQQLPKFNVGQNQIPIYFTYGITDKDEGPYNLNNDNDLINSAFIEVKWWYTNPAEGVFDWTLIDNKVRDWTGSSDPNADTAKKVFIRVATYDQDPLSAAECQSRGPNCQVGDNSITPPWVYGKGVPRISFKCGGICGIQGVDALVSVPKVWDSRFYGSGSPYDAFLAALGNHYNNDKRIAGFIPGFGHLGTMNAQPAASGSIAFIENAGWTLPLWRDYINNVLSLSKRVFSKSLIFRVGGKFLENYKGQSFKLEDHLDIAQQILQNAAQNDVSILFHGLTPNKDAYIGSAAPALVSFLGGLNIQSPLFKIGFDDDFPLWVPPDRQGCPGATCGRDEVGFDKELSYAFETWDSIGRKYPMFMAFLQPETSTTNKNYSPCAPGEPHDTRCFRQSVYDVAAKWLFVTPPSPDVTPPAVSITAPLNGATISGTVSVSANASDDVGVVGVQFKLDGANLGAEDTSSPYSISWNTISASNGFHVLSAVARDAAGNNGTALAVTVTVNNAPPPIPVAFSRGVYSLTAFGDTPSPVAWANPNVSGVVIRTSWGDIETSEGQYNWGYIDNQITAAKANGKKLAIHIKAGSTKNNGLPNWLLTQYPGLQRFSYYDDTQKIVFAAPWDPLYLQKLKSFINAFGSRYKNESAVAYLRLGGGQSILSGWEASADLYDEGGITKLSWATAGFTSDRLVASASQTIDTFMTALPATVLWDEPETISAWQNIPGATEKTSVSEKVTAYGFSKYPNYGAWREDLHACTDLNPTGVTGYEKLFKILWDHPGKNGAQMVWSVQDGTDGNLATFRMNPKGNCVADEEKDGDFDRADVLRKAVDVALAYQMPYIEVYQADITDSRVASVIAYAKAKLLGIDITPPTVSITTPANGNTVSGTIPVNANASDNVGVAGVQFKLNGINLGIEDATAPYGISWDTTTVTNGFYTLTATARDAANNQTTSSGVTVTVSNAPQTFNYSLTNSGTITVAQGASGSNTITATLIQGNTQSVSFSASGLPTGASASLTPISCSPTCTSTLAISTLSSTPVGSYTITVTGSPLGKTTTFTLTVTFPTTKFIIGDRVQTTVTLNVRATPSISGTLLGTQAAGALGTVVGGPVVADGYNWWHINYDNAPDGWSVENFIVKIFYPPPPATLTCSPASQTVQVNTRANFTAAGGTGSYSWLAPGGNPSSGSGSAFSTSYASQGSYTVTVASGPQAAGCGVAVSQLPPPPVAPALSFSANPVAINTGGNVTLTWVSSDANSCSASGGWSGPKSTSGNESVGPIYTDVSFTLSCMGDGGTVTKSVTVTIGTPPAADTLPPTVFISEPPVGIAVSGPLYIEATASDNVGVLGVQFTVDGAPIGREAVTIPFTLTWDTRAVANGRRLISATARDAAGNVGTAPGVMITVFNSTTDYPPPPIPSDSTVSFKGRILAFGSRDALVPVLQRFLIAGGFMAAGNDTGYFGPLTREGVVRFQQKYGILSTGVVGPITAAKLDELRLIAPAPIAPGGTGSFSRALYLGLRDPEVTTLQQFLIKRGLLSAGSNSGYFGIITEAAVQKFQCQERIVCGGDRYLTG
ncbi:MAG: peptidoglycan-binding protein, partial [Candidatus Sungbacteria bacterium]|nr:peptidoglycan-binding protein [Candidatus Sungbacteria bacterium]